MAFEEVFRATQAMEERVYPGRSPLPSHPARARRAPAPPPPPRRPGRRPLAARPADRPHRQRPRGPRRPGRLGAHAAASTAGSAASTSRGPRRPWRWDAETGRLARYVGRGSEGTAWNSAQVPAVVRFRTPEATTPCHPRPARFWTRHSLLYLALLLRRRGRIRPPAAARSNRILDDAAVPRRGPPGARPPLRHGLRRRQRRLRRDRAALPRPPGRPLPALAPALVGDPGRSRRRVARRRLLRRHGRGDRALRPAAARRSARTSTACSSRPAPWPSAAACSTDRKHWLRAALDGRKALQLLEEVRKREPDNPDLLLGVGLFDYLADVAPRQYPILKPFTRFFPKGDRQRGLQEISAGGREGDLRAPPRRPSAWCRSTTSSSTTTRPRSTTPAGCATAIRTTRSSTSTRGAPSPTSTSGRTSARTSSTCWRGSPRGRPAIAAT